MNQRADLQRFPATHGEAMARIAAVDVERYGATRNSLGGAVSGLSPYITHGIVTPAEVFDAIAARQAIGVQHKFVAELGWRCFYRHVWQHQGDAIFKSIQPGPLAGSDYDTAFPEDVRHARSGVPVIDQSVRQLYATGYLHNHARLWLASYLVHVRKLHWRIGADWLYGHLLDGDLASNYLSWQWVAGTGSSKPYLFNAENVERFASRAWHSRGSAIDISYEALDLLARNTSRRCGEPGEHGEGLAEPAVSSIPPQALLNIPEPSDVAGKDVWLVHPWALRQSAEQVAPDCVRLGVIVSDFHARWPWSERRWNFVAEAMLAVTDQCWHGDASNLVAALSGARSVRSVAEPHLQEWLPQMASTEAVENLFPNVDKPCASFSKWWTRVAKSEDLFASRGKLG